MEKIMAEIQNLKLDAWKGGYLAGKGMQDQAHKMRIFLARHINEIEMMLKTVFRQPTIPTNKIGNFSCECGWLHYDVRPGFKCSNCGATYEK